MVKRAGAVTFKGTPMTLVGPEVKVGDKAPDFKCATGPMSSVTLADTPAKARFFSVVPSLDTAVCSLQTRKFESLLAGMADRVEFYTVSIDTPFAQKRFAEDESNPLKTVKVLSDMADHSFGEHYGVLMEGLAMPLLTRAVFVVDARGTVRHAEYVAEVTHEPNYDAAMAALKDVA